MQTTLSLRNTQGVTVQSISISATWCGWSAHRCHTLVGNSYGKTALSWKIVSNVTGVATLDSARGRASLSGRGVQRRLPPEQPAVRRCLEVANKDGHWHIDAAWPH